MCFWIPLANAGIERQPSPLPDSSDHHPPPSSNMQLFRPRTEGEGSREGGSVCLPPPPSFFLGSEEDPPGQKGGLRRRRRLHPRSPAAAKVAAAAASAVLRRRYGSPAVSENGGLEVYIHRSSFSCTFPAFWPISMPTGGIWWLDF